MYIMQLVCSQCKITKEDILFSKASRNKKTGRASECKKCQAKYAKDKYDKNYLMVFKIGGECCKDCGLTGKPAKFYDWHHLDESTKTNEVTSLLTSTKEKLLTEVKKCVLLCPNCHRERHIKEKRDEFN